MLLNTKLYRFTWFNFIKLHRFYEYNKSFHLLNWDIEEKRNGAWKVCHSLLLRKRRKKKLNNKNRITNGQHILL